ncbi:hypothetical protein J5N97_003399 [Dioscorea zingiberensis]|uniref:Uncharacterized protein n=1 Tax=Dioscorea zingiberensis TaxID=325984 RepID=A0A9D5D6K1_9LILI|nr:hypothetical protein J5N97_003399 [Dioscorea zingiberensis]
MVGHAAASCPRRGTPTCEQPQENIEVSVAVDRLPSGQARLGISAPCVDRASALKPQAPDVEMILEDHQGWRWTQVNRRRGRNRGRGGGHPSSSREMHVRADASPERLQPDGVDVQHVAASDRSSLPRRSGCESGMVQHVVADPSFDSQPVNREDNFPVSKRGAEVSHGRSGRGGRGVRGGRGIAPQLLTRFPLPGRPISSSPMVPDGGFESQPSLCLPSSSYSTGLEDVAAQNPPNLDLVLHNPEMYDYVIHYQADDAVPPFLLLNI